MKKFIRIVLTLFFLFLFGLIIFWLNRSLILEKSLELYLNHTQKAFFSNTLDLSQVHVDMRLHFSVDQVTGTYQMPEGPFPFEVHSIWSENSILDFVKGKPLFVEFHRLRPQGSDLSGIKGKVKVQDLMNPVMEISGNFNGLDFKDLTVLNPENLEGATGYFTGDFFIQTNFLGRDNLVMELSVREPGGTLQSRFFDVLVPYMPPAQKKLVEVIQDEALVGYKEADLSVALDPEESALKIFLHILVPDYNLNLNLNLKVLVEDSRAFMQLAELLGLIKIEA